LFVFLLKELLSSLPQEELQLWKEEPEEFLAVDEEDNAQHSRRVCFLLPFFAFCFLLMAWTLSFSQACAEQVFTQLLAEFKSTVVPLTLQLAQRFSGEAVSFLTGKRK